MAKIYFTYNNVACEDFELIFENDNSDSKAIYFDEVWWRNFNDTRSLEATLGSTGNVAKGASLYVCPDCPIASADIRQSYTIKRDIDAGDYNVFSPLKSKHIYRTNWIYAMAILPSLKKVYCSTRYKVDKIQFVSVVKALYPQQNDVIFHFKDVKRFFQMKFPSDAWRMLLEHKLQKPAICYTQLDLRTGYDLTTDALRIAYEMGKQRWSEQNEKSFLLQMGAINETNWRDYTGTLSMLIYQFLGDRNNTCSFSRAHQSRFPKQVKEIFTQARESQGFVSQEDQELARAFFDEIVGTTGTQYVTAQTLLSKLQELGLSLQTFDKLYNNIVKLSPKQYVQE